ncbi:MAG: glycosyltransferase 87 family protein [Endomicrobium sp.]|jgi:hypothetical protein|nr:glycosyltransferase 87 family protein [Endomicrobium sp.]
MREQFLPFIIQTALIIIIELFVFAAACAAYVLIKKRRPFYSENDYCGHIWFVCMSVCLAAFSVEILCDWNAIFNIVLKTANDSFMDFFNPVSYILSSQPYEAGLNACYSGLSFLFYLIIAKITAAQNMPAEMIKSSVSGQYALFFYTLITALLFCILVFKFEKSKNLPRKIILTTLIFCSAPFIYQFERANIIFIANLFITAFFICFQSKNKKIFEIGLICLAAAAAIKIYPAVFILLLIKEKKLKEVLRFVLYFLLLFTVPFFIIGSADTISCFAESLSILSGISKGIISSHWVSLHNFLAVPCAYFDALYLITPMRILFTILVGVSFFMEKSLWKSAALLTALIILLPHRSAQYVVILTVAPLILFLNDSDKKLKDIIYSVLFAGTFIPIAVKSACLFTSSVMFENVSLIFLSVLIIYETGAGIFQKIKGTNA